MSYGKLEVKSVGKFLKIEPNQTVRINILTKSEDIGIRYLHSFDDKIVECMINRCDLCENQVDRIQKFIVNVFDRNDSKVKLFEFGASIANQIKQIAQMLEDDQLTIHDVDLKINRKGLGKQTKYMVIQAPKQSAVPRSIQLHEIRNVSHRKQEMENDAIEPVDDAFGEENNG